MRSRREIVLGASAAAATLAAWPLARAAEADVASTAYGPVRGRQSDGVIAFKGIPYGAPTSGKGRFRPPGPPTPWSGVRDAFDYAAAAPQPLPELAPSLFASWSSDKTISEDCLALNVWTPALRDGTKRPVMVSFHGGDYSSLSGSSNRYDGTRLARNGDVVVVTVNHRLNAFGYLYLAELVPDLADAGNAGLLDLVAALQWVRDNIAEFGGDPASVTIFGQSGGGAKVSMLMAMPAAKGLFHRAIIQSGTYARSAHLEAIRPAEATRRARALLSAMEIAPESAIQLVDAPMEALVAAAAKVARMPGRPQFRPVADGRALPSGPWEPTAPAASAEVPLIIGTCETETTFLIGAFDPDAFTLDEARLRRWLGFLFARDDIEKVLSAFRATRPAATPSDLYFAITTAATFRKGAWREAEQKATQAKAPVYLYEFDWRTPVDSGKWGSPHSVDTALAFDNVGVSASMDGAGPEAQKMADQISATWIAFARTGDPNNANIPHWPRYTPAERATMVFNLQSKVVNDYRGEERALLAELKVRNPFD